MSVYRHQRRMVKCKLGVSEVRVGNLRNLCEAKAIGLLLLDHLVVYVLLSPSPHVTHSAVFLNWVLAHLRDHPVLFIAKVNWVVR